MMVPASMGFQLVLPLELVAGCIRQDMVAVVVAVPVAVAVAGA